MDIKLKKLLKDLTNKDDDLRALSAMTLMKLDFPEKSTREEVLLNLIQATQDKNVAVRFFSRKAIDKIRRAEKLLKAAIGETTAVPVEERLASNDYQDRLAAVMEIKAGALADYKERLLAMLDSEEHAFVRASLISCLSGFLKKDEAALLSGFLADADNRVRSNTIEALEILKAEDSIPALFSALSDPDNRIRAAAAKALQGFGEEKVFKELKKMLESPEEWMKGSAIYALSHIQAGEAIELLLETARQATHVETRVKAIIALANYHDSSAWGFLKGLSSGGEGIFKETAQKAVKLMEEKFGPNPPTATMITIQAGDSAEGSNPDGKAVEAAKPEDLAATVTRFFRKGRDEAIGLSNRAALSFTVTDHKKELDELYKEAGRATFDIYQAGEIEFADMLSIGHEILRMNFFVQKYTEQEQKLAASSKPEGFFGQLKSLFSKSAEQKATASQAEKFAKKRDELFLKLGQLALKKYEKEEFRHKLLDVHFVTLQKLNKKIAGEEKK